MNARYIIVDVFDHYASNGATLTEINLYDSFNVKQSYSPTELFQTSNDSSWWNHPTSWGKSNLNDGQTSYSSNSTGATTTTFLLGVSEPNTGHFARFVLDLLAVKDVSIIKLFAGSPEGRIPKKVSFYGCVTYSRENNLVARKNDGLIPLGEVLFTGDEMSVRELEAQLTINQLFLVSDNNGDKYYNNGWQPVL